MTVSQSPTTIILARHGAAEYESQRWALEGGSLTTHGRAQAHELAETLRDRRVTHIWTSTLARAVQTAEIAAAVLDVAVTTRCDLRELDTGDLAGSSRDEDPFAPTYGAWLRGDLEARIPGAESGHEVVARFRAVLGEIADRHAGETVLVVSHGGALRLAVPAIARLDAGPARLANCGSIELQVDAGLWVCSAWSPPPESPR